MNRVYRGLSSKTMGDRLQQNLCLSQGIPGKKEEGRALVTMVSGNLSFQSVRPGEMYLGPPSIVLQVLHFTIPGGIIFTLESS